MRVAREAAIAGLGAAVYFGVRELVEGGHDESVANAERILDVERFLALDIERDAQDLVLDHDVLRALGDISYVWLHWPLLVVALATVLARDSARYRRLRDALFVSGAVGLVLFAVFPVAPPRFVGGYVGTVSDAARMHYLPIPLEWSNQYAAFPSFHAAWTLLACLALVAVAPPRAWRYVLLLPAVMVTMAVLTTGNHYVLDLVAGVTIALAADRVVLRRTRAAHGCEDEHVIQWRRTRK